MTTREGGQAPAPATAADELARAFEAGILVGYEACLRDRDMAGPARLRSLVGRPMNPPAPVVVLQATNQEANKGENHATGRDDQSL